MTAWWKIHDKPRGRYRPLMEWGVYLSDNELGEIRTLNISTDIKYCLRGNGKCAGNCNRIDIVLPAAPYGREDKIVDKGYGIGRGYSCTGEAKWCLYDVDYLPKNWAVRLPWRPGAHPDYSDFIVPVRDFLRRVLEEMERRFVEARESAPSDRWLMEEKFDLFSACQENEEVAERKLRVIRV